jgi:predicted ABC-type transport system involved in lysophospholipase L1 biosynthesis ATPase subunit
VSKQHGSARPLRIADLTISPLDRLVLAGFDASAAEMFVLLVTGAALPDEGEVRVAGQSTRDIHTDVEWLHSLDRFGLVTARAVLIDQLSTAANLALPLTLSIDPMSEETRSRVASLAQEVGLPVQRLDALIGELSALERLRVHVARAMALNPILLLLENPTAGLKTRADIEAFGATLRDVGQSREIGWVAISDETTLARTSGATRLQLVTETGELRRDRSRLRDWFR